RHIASDKGEDLSMNKFPAAGALALTAVVAAAPEAPAWINFKFGAGVNWSWQSGGNNFLWGLFRNGQPPGPDGPHGPGYPGRLPGKSPNYGPQEFQYFGGQPGGAGYGMQYPTAPEAAPPSQTPGAPVALYHPATWHGQHAYQMASWYGNPAYQAAYY